MISKKFNKNYLIPILVSTALIILLGLTFWMIFHQSRNYVDKLIVDDLNKIEEILKKINKTAGILNFEQDKTHVDFLNVEKFAGSQVGGLSLAHPEKWEGPYVITNPTIQEKFYQIIKTKKAYYLAPGDGVKLANGKIIGKDIILNKDSNIEKMIKDKKLISYDNPLAIKIATYKEAQHEKNESPIEPFIREDSELY